MRYFLSLIILLLSLSICQAQNEALVIKDIQVIGNKKTKTNIVLRELDFRIGDTIDFRLFSEIVELNQLLLINTNLFNKADFVATYPTDDEIVFTITVVEDWYIFPLIGVDLADRNFNVWWVEQNHALNRLDIGLHLIHNNFTGRKDYGRLVTEFGYTQRLQFEYRRPYINEAQTIGFYANAYVGRNREIGYQVVDDTLRFKRLDDEFAMQRGIGEVEFQYRPALWAKHKARLSYNDYSVSDSITALNPDFFLNGAKRQQFFTLNYNFLYDRRDLKRYPLNGYFVQVDVLKEGLGIFDQINSLYLSAAYGKYWQAKKWSWSLDLKARKGLIQDKQPYYNSRALGYENDFIRGYEYFVIDGQDYAYAKGMMRYELFNRTFQLGKWMPIKAFKELPFKIYSKIYTEHGYVNAPFYSEGNSLNNSYLRSAGTGIDFVLYHDFVFRYEYSVNHLGQKGLYLHFDFIF